ncbi:hypothetical protein N510_001666 [Firmicutes bacterium ASF500]|nr:hypothetical protein N510_001666 [Firmicutes bacterium ASF500]
MRIQHNIMAMNAYRNYNINTGRLSKNLEKLSSGYKINRAGDDAAGLAISEKMRAQITGLNAAQKNVKDGISLVKTAEGAMQEIQDMLNRMDYLATQSANGTYQNEVDRENLQKEVVALKEEINRIADSANFNGIKLLDGTQAGKSTDDVGEIVEVTAVNDAVQPTRVAQKGEYSVDLSNFTAKASATGVITIKVGGLTVATATVTSGMVSKGAITLTVGNFNFVSSASATIGGVEFTINGSGNTITLKMNEVPTTDFAEDMSVELTGDTSNNQGLPGAVHIDKPAVKEEDNKYAQGTFNFNDLDIKDGSQIRIGNQVYTFAVGKDSTVKGSNVIDLKHMNEGDSTIGTEAAIALSKTAKGNSWFKVTSDNKSSTVYLTERKNVDRPYKNDMVGDAAQTDADWNGEGEGATAMVQFSADGGLGGGGGLTLQIGDTAETFNQMGVRIGDMHVDALGIDSVDIGTQAGAQAAIQQIKDAINNVSSVRGDLGAIQNRLEHTQNNLSVMAENIQDAESTIRDTDVAEEMMSYVKNNILVQSAQAMLAQANQVPQGVLQLLG